MKKILFFTVLCLFPLSAEVRVAVFDAGKSICFVDENGQADGLYPELLREIFKNSDQELRFITGLSFQEAQNLVLSGGADIMPGFLRSPEREKVFSFNDEVIMVSWSQVFIHPDNYIESVLDLQGSRIALMEGGQNGKNFQALMESFDFPFEAVYFPNFKDMTEAVLSGEVQGMVSYGTYVKNEERLKASNIIFHPSQAYVAVRKGGPEELLTLIDEQLSGWKAHEGSLYYQLLEKWLLVGKSESIPLWHIGILVSLASGFILILLFIILLKMQVFRIKKQLLESETRYQTLFQAAGDCIFLMELDEDNQGRYIEINQIYFEKSGFSREEVIGSSIFEVYEPLEEHDLSRANLDLLKNGYSTMESRLRTRSGELIPVETSSQLYNLGDKRFVISISRDIKERKKLEEKILHKQKLESIGILAGGVAHDFNNILAIIKGFSDIGSNRNSEDSQNLKLFKTISQAVSRGEYLTSQILDFSRNIKTEKNPVQISAEINDLFALIEPTFPKNIKLVKDLKTNAFISANTAQVEQLLMNLCTNARQAMPAGGCLEFRLCELSISEIQREVPEFRNRRCMKLSVSDTGLGMDDDIKQRVFDPFFTTRDVGEGSGLGLSVIHGFVSDWGGSIQVDSSPGIGSCFNFYFPILDYHIFVDEHSAPVVHPGDFSRILILDDEPMILDLMEYILVQNSYKVDRFSDSREALDAFCRDPERYKIAILDKTMPEISGNELALEFKKLNNAMPIILCSGFNKSQIPIELPANIDGVIGKPFDKNHLLNLVDQLLNQQHM